MEIAEAAMKKRTNGKIGNIGEGKQEGGWNRALERKRETDKRRERQERRWR